MSKYIKGEFYKLFSSNHLKILFILTLLYSLIVGYLYWSDGAFVENVFSNFNQEFMLYYLFVSLFYSSSVMTEEYDYGTIIYLKNNRLLFAKLMMICLYLVMIFFISLLFMYDVSLFIYKFQTINLNVLVDCFLYFIKSLPMYVFINYICLCMSLLVKRANLSLIISCGVYLSSNYISSLIVSKEMESLYFLPALYWDFNNVQLDVYSRYIQAVIVLCSIVFVVCLIICLFKSLR
ncbi:MAG: ABC transporter permease [Bacilli bacterium]|nr:ABC transporter permease [Bacilli bacterium]